MVGIDHTDHTDHIDYIDHTAHTDHTDHPSEVRKDGTGKVAGQFQLSEPSMTSKHSGIHRGIHGFGVHPGF